MKQIHFLTVLILSLIFIGSCKKDEQLPVLITHDVTEITASTAFCGGNITYDGGSTVTTRGVCWSTSENPTISDSKTSDGGGAGSFASEIKNLEPGTTYYVRAYATNIKGTGYGSTMVFKTIGDSVTTGESFTDSRDGTVYKTVKIGKQVWMAENLKYLPSVVGSSTGSRTKPYYYVYGYNGTSVNDAKATSNYKTYGVLYNWPTALTACPAGWHLPSDDEWTYLENFLADNGYNYDGSIGGGRDKIAKAMASATGWNSSSGEGEVGNTDYPEYQNKSGFTALPGGHRSYNGNFDYIGYGGNWWSSTEYDTNNAWYRSMYYNYSNVSRNTSNKEYGFSVRCVRD